MILRFFLPPQAVVDFLVLLPHELCSIPLLFLPMRSHLAAGLDRLSRRNPHAVVGIVGPYRQEIVSAALAPARDIPRRHSPAEVVVEEAGQFLKLDLLRKAPLPGSVGHCLERNLKWE